MKATPPWLQSPVACDPNRPENPPSPQDTAKKREKKVITASSVTTHKSQHPSTPILIPKQTQPYTAQPTVCVVCVRITEKMKVRVLIRLKGCLFYRKIIGEEIG